MDSIALHPLGQDAIVIQCALRVDDKVVAQIQDIKARLEEHVIDGVVEIVPALTSVLVRFDPILVSRDRVLEFIKPHCDEASLRDATVPTLSRLWTIPVCVTGPAAPDLAEVSSLTGMSEQALIGMLENAAGGASGAARPRRAVTSASADLPRLIKWLECDNHQRPDHAANKPAH